MTSSCTMIYQERIGAAKPGKIFAGHIKSGEGSMWIHTPSETYRSSRRITWKRPGRARQPLRRKRERHLLPRAPYFSFAKTWAAEGVADEAWIRTGGDRMAGIILENRGEEAGVSGLYGRSKLFLLCGDKCRREVRRG
jgi:hypothetical protein